VKASRRIATAARYAAYSQIAFFSTLAVCLALVQWPLVDGLGLSYYGTVRATVVPYAAGLLLAGYFMSKAAHALPRGSASLRLLSEALLVLAILAVGVCLTPYSFDVLFKWAHFAASALLFVVELLLAAWLAWDLRPRALNLALLALQLLGASIALASEWRVVQLMLPGEVLTQLAFGVLLVRCLSLMAHPRGAAPARPPEDFL
jgi:hypothetical protein